ncbi:hypothetical protein F2Q70_00042656 [Brassica cretica]|uniref:Uncharacterized protein n=1 Tax=Brassica cretica TaxID=69181 RepID=A0A8S9KG21_BRACR|nr:hypothetical protein F2Q70_00042656 [Brassica cretica]
MPVLEARRSTRANVGHQMSNPSLSMIFSALGLSSHGFVFGSLLPKGLILSGIRNESDEVLVKASVISELQRRVLKSKVALREKEEENDILRKDCSSTTTGGLNTKQSVGFLLDGGNPLGLVGDNQTLKLGHWY